MTEHLELPATERRLRALSAAAERVADVLSGRTVWCATALPDASRAADELRGRVDGAGPGVAAVGLELSAPDPLRRLAGILGRALTGRPSTASSFGPAERSLCAEAASEGDELLGACVSAGDVVVAHDALSVLATPAVRERGAHAVWRVDLSRRSRGAAEQALDFLRSFTGCVDAYVLRWTERDQRGHIIERVAAAMPCSGLVAAKEFAVPSAGDEWRRLVWRMALAEVVRSDREECVGGRLHPRPAVAIR